ncbi:hypothetical protein OPIT5_08310 [Opitutaceae bacterium TAV5]|nr:hypothetical protein OPIT5_08310 [Opitutaceae bacterium TAV5]
MKYAILARDTSPAPILAHFDTPQALGDITEIPAEIMIFPAGTHTINASQDGEPVTKTVAIGPDTAAVVNAALQAHLRTERKPYFDFDHNDTVASAWPKSCRWEAGTGDKKPGVYAAVDWSASGSAAVIGKDYRSFSPAFHVDDSTPARVIGAPLNMGGLVNAPAFHAQAPLWAKDRQPESDTTMTEEEKKKAADEAAAKAAEEAKEKESEAILAKEQNAELQKRLQTLEAKETARVKADAAAKVDAAVARGALPAKDEAIKAKWVALIEADPANAALLDGLPGNDMTRLVTDAGGHITAKAGPVEVLKGYHAAKAALDRSAIYAKDIAPLFKPGFSLGPILAAHDLGTLAPELVTQRSLSFLKLSYPFLGAITTNFSSENAAFEQTIKTRLRGPLVANSYTTANGYGNNNANTQDVDITIDQHIGVPLTFNVNELASTARDLFGEQSESAHYAIGTAVINHLFSLITAANFAKSTASKLSLFTRRAVSGMAKEMNKDKVHPAGRFLLLNPDFFEQLGGDATLVQLAAYQKPEYITEYRLPPVAGFTPYEAVSLPVAASLAGFAGTSESLALATRVPSDYTKALPGASNGVVSTVINPDTNIAVQLVQYVNHDLATATARIALMFGGAVGNPATGRRLTQTAEA